MYFQPSAFSFVPGIYVFPVEPETTILVSRVAAFLSRKLEPQTFQSNLLIQIQFVILNLLPVRSFEES